MEVDDFSPGVALLRADLGLPKMLLSAPAENDTDLGGLADRGLLMGDGVRTSLNKSVGGGGVRVVCVSRRVSAVLRRCKAALSLWGDTPLSRLSTTEIRHESE